MKVSELPAAGDVPEVEFAGAAPGRDRLAVGGEGDPVDELVLRVRDHHAQFPAAFGVPEPDLALADVAVDGCQNRGVRGEDRAKIGRTGERDRSLAERDLSDFRQEAHVPDPQGSVA